MNDAQPLKQRTSLATRRREQTRHELAAAALRRIEETGSWSRVRVEDLLDDVGISERTFYRYFERKHDVLSPLLQDLTVRFHELFTQTQGSLEHRAGFAFEEALSGIEGGLDGGRTLLRVFLSDPDLASIWQAAGVASELGLAKSVRHVVTPAHSDHAHLVAAMIVLGQRFAIQQWVKPDESAPLSELIEITVGVVLRTKNW